MKKGKSFLLEEKRWLFVSFVRRSGPFDLDLKSFLDLTVGFCDNELESVRD